MLRTTQTKSIIQPTFKKMLDEGIKRTIKNTKSINNDGKTDITKYLSTNLSTNFLKNGNGNDNYNYNNYNNYKNYIYLFFSFLAGYHFRYFITRNTNT
jgi:hypothetical protein